MAEHVDREGTDPASSSASLSRRKFLQGAGTAAASTVLARGLLAEPDARADAASSEDPERLSGELEITLDINGAKQNVRVEPRTSLLSALRNRCDPPLTGTKDVCDRGQCGACTVIVDGKPAYACLLLAVSQRGKAIRTIEGLGTPDNLTPLQSAFCERDASMCGFCTSGFVMAITACLEKTPGADLERIQRACAGNVCRCGTYPHIFQAALDVSQAGTGGGER